MSDGDSISLLYEFEHARHKRDTETHPVAQQAWALRCAKLEREIAVRNVRATEPRATEPRDREITASNLTDEQILEVKAASAAAVKTGRVTERHILGACEVAMDQFSPRRQDARIEIAARCNALRNHPCCTHPIERHAYNGCADCMCNMRWVEHPGRMFDMSFDQHTRDAVSKQRIDSAAERLTTEQIVALKSELPAYAESGLANKLSAACAVAMEFFDSDERTEARALIAAWISATSNVTKARSSLADAIIARDAIKEHL